MKIVTDRGDGISINLFIVNDGSAVLHRRIRLRCRATSCSIQLVISLALILSYPSLVGLSYPENNLGQEMATMATFATYFALAALSF